MKNCKRTHMQPLKMNCGKIFFPFSCLETILNDNALEICNNFFALLKIQYFKDGSKSIFTENEKV